MPSSGNPQVLADLAIQYRFPAINNFPDFAQNGGLIGYGPEIQSLFTQVGLLTRKLMEGAAIADLPVERPTRFKLMINLKTASRIGVTASLCKHFRTLSKHGNCRMCPFWCASSRSPLNRRADKVLKTYEAAVETK